MISGPSNDNIVGLFSGCWEDPYSALSTLYNEIKSFYNVDIINNNEYNYSVIISNRPIPSYFNGTVIYYLDNQDIEFFKIPNNSNNNKIKKHFFTPSHYCSKLLYSICKIESIVCPPCFDKTIISGNKIAIDPTHPAMLDFDKENIEFVYYPKTKKDFEGCKLFLPCSYSPFDIRLWWAEQQGCLIGGIKNENIPEEFIPNYIEYQNGSWTKYCRKALVDASKILLKLRKNIKNYDGCVMDENIKKALKQKPIRSEVVRTFQEIQTFAQKNTIVPRKVVRQHINRQQDSTNKQSVMLAQKEKKYLFWTGGIGDVLTLDSYISPEDRNEVLSFFYATRKQNLIKELFLNNKAYPKLNTHQTVWDDFKDRWCFYSKSEVISKLDNTKKIPQLLLSEDWSIGNKFNEIRNKIHKFHGSSFLLPKNNLCEITQNIPEKFYTICPFSTDKSMKARDFTENDWKQVIKFLEYKSIPGVILYSGIDKSPISNNLIDLSNKTSILESVEILKKSIGYIGVDSCFSVLASQLFEIKQMCIKSVNAHLYSNINIYYAPHTSFPFVHKDVALGLNYMKS